MIYTSYFAQLRNFPKDFVPVAICAGLPSWYNGLSYKKVAPKYWFFQKWKQNHDNDFYIENFNKEVLNNITPKEFIDDINKLTNNAENIVLLCYEKPSDFCHRHLVANWINKSNLGISIKEWKK